MRSKIKTFFCLISSLRLHTCSNMSCENQLRVPISTSTVTTNLKYLSQSEAAKIDEELFTEYKFSVDQLMELAGLSVASAVSTFLPSESKSLPVLVVCGPGNNGGDGLVAARHLKLFGFGTVEILAGKRPTKELYLNLLHQAEENDIRISYDASEFDPKVPRIIIDALFGFSFTPPVRPNFFPLMSLLLSSSQNPNTKIISVDIPSGWHVENGPQLADDSSNESRNSTNSSNLANENSLMPHMLISLTAPKKCAQYFRGEWHILGGRFVPRKLGEKYELNLPTYPNTQNVVRL